MHKGVYKFQNKKLQSLKIMNNNLLPFYHIFVLFHLLCCYHFCHTGTGLFTQVCFSKLSMINLLVLKFQLTLKIEMIKKIPA
jgi:hypothetical protein